MAVPIAARSDITPEFTPGDGDIDCHVFLHYAIFITPLLSPRLCADAFSLFIASSHFVSAAAIFQFHGRRQD